MAFNDPTDPDRVLQIPVRGHGGKIKKYAIQPLSAELGPAAQALFDSAIAAKLAEDRGEKPGEIDVELLSDLMELDFYPQVLGDAYDELIAGGVSWPDVKQLAMVVMTDACVSREAAEALWNGEMGKAPNRATRRAAARKATVRSARPASTAGTTRTRPVKKASRSRGGGSSSAGSS